MDNDTDNDSFSTDHSSSGDSSRPRQSGEDGLEQVRDQLAGLDDWEGLPDETTAASFGDANDGDSHSEASGSEASETSDHATSDHVTSDHVTSDHATSDQATSDQATSDQATSDGEPGDGRTNGVNNVEADDAEHDTDVITLGDVDDDLPMADETEQESEVPDADLDPLPATAAVAAQQGRGFTALPEPEPIGPPIEEFGLEMRQVAGLTAGSSMKLPPGKMFQFNETTTASTDEADDSASFVLRVSDEGRVIVMPGTATAIVNEMVVDEPTFVGNGILSVGSACFTVRPMRETTPTSTLERAEIAMSAPRAITVGELNDETGTEELLQSIRETRHQVAERHRLTHPDPEELKSRLSLVDPGLWERGRSHRFFGRYSVGYAIIPWQPKFDEPDRIPEDLHGPINKMSVLPWVPITTSLTQGPIAIHGGRAAVLAACRHAVLSLAALTAPGDIRFSVVTGRDQVTDWQWTKSLPELMSPARDSGEPVDPTAYYQLSVVDGAGHLEPAGLAIGDAGPDYGIIVLGPNRQSVPEGCATYIAAGDDGTAIVTNHLGEEISSTPIGITEAFAHDMATRIADILIGYG